MALCFVVDDDELTCDLASRSLAMIGLNVQTYFDGLEALNYCKIKMPDLVILDMKMPTMDGFEFIKAIRKMHGGSAVRIIACTGMSDAETVRILKDAGIVDFLVKPFDNRVLVRKVEKLRLN